jgi:hypothetical protein
MTDILMAGIPRRAEHIVRFPSMMQLRGTACKLRQSESPPLEERLQILHLMEFLEMKRAGIGLPGAGSPIANETLCLAMGIASQKLRIWPYRGALTFIADIRTLLL